MLTPDDLAYMRATQAEARPTEATLRRRSTTPASRSALGGRTPGIDQDLGPVAIRIDNDPNPPQELATEHGIHLVRVTADLVKIEEGDELVVSSTEKYLVVSHGDTDPWTTAQRLWAVRTVRVAADG